MMIPDPSWANHRPLLQGGGLVIEEYPYFDQATHTVDVDNMISALEKAPAKTAIMLQVAAHNPTGVDLSDEQWDRVLQVCVSRVRSNCFVSASLTALT